ncbi:unnamed protein product [Caenorhabditis bovis]|uniref:Treslin STD domain-containing protein n=1 Tax=Caenorhabditis bovis TaxID=2654633 RepID=A0A8S1F871_9PELO|nr:unnamed protein product [Caenorhabditis bovis]
MNGKTFEDFTFEMLNRLSPVKLQRSEIPFDSVREIILNEINLGKQICKKARSDNTVSSLSYTILSSLKITEYNARQSTQIAYFPEDSLPSALEELYWNLLNDSKTSSACAYYSITDTLNLYYRDKTWDNHCEKLCCSVLSSTIYRTCQQLNEAHESKDCSDEIRIKELQTQVLFGLHLFAHHCQDQTTHLDDVINKLRLIFITADSQRMRTFLEEDVTDIFIDYIPESLAKIYEDLCISIPIDLAQYESGFKRSIKKEIEEVVEQTPMAKLRMAANKSRNRYSKRLSEMVKKSEANTQMTTRAREMMEKKIEKAKIATPLRSIRSYVTLISMAFDGEVPDEGCTGEPTQKNRAGRVKIFNEPGEDTHSIYTSEYLALNPPTGFGRHTYPLFGSHVLLNSYNPDFHFDWNKVKDKFKIFENMTPVEKHEKARDILLNIKKEYLEERSAKYKALGQKMSEKMAKKKALITAKNEKASPKKTNVKKSPKKNVVKKEENDDLNEFGLHEEDE